MVKRCFINYRIILPKILLALILSIPINLHSVSAVDRKRLIENIKREFEKRFAEMEREKLTPDEIKEALTFEKKMRISPEVIFTQYKNFLDDKAQEELLKSLLRDYSSSQIERQELLNSLLVTYSYKELLSNISTDNYKSVGENANPSYVGVTSIIDWINTSHFNGFFQPTMINTLIHRETFNDFNSLNQWGLCIEPFGFYTNFRRDTQPLQFDLYTVGLTIGGQYIFSERFVFGLGCAYSYSGIDGLKGKNTANVNSLYFGPSLSYLFSNGYLNCTLFGLANFYQVGREIQLFDKIEKPKQTQADYIAWDAVFRMEGGFTYPLGRHFFLYPTLRVDYLNAFQHEHFEQMDKEVKMEVKSSNESFLCSKASLKITREFFNPGIGFLIPSVSVGWFYFSPLSKQSYQYQIEECSPFEKTLGITSWNQYFLGAGFSIVHKAGVLVSLDYEATLGAGSPLHAGSLRIEWSW